MKEEKKNIKKEFSRLSMDASKRAVIEKIDVVFSNRFGGKFIFLCLHDLMVVC